MSMNQVYGEQEIHNTSFQSLGGSLDTIQKPAHYEEGFMHRSSYGKTGFNYNSFLQRKRLGTQTGTGESLKS